MTEIFTPRQIEVATAAGPVFLTRGFARTTMGDIARAAQLSRQGLYLIFPGKEEVFTAAVTVLDDQMHAELARDIEACTGLAAKLNAFFDRWIISVFELQRSTPDSRDMDDLAFPVVRAVYARKISLIRQLLLDQAGGTLAPERAADLARVTMFAVRGFFATATDNEDLRRLARLQIDLLASHLQQPGR